ncbi:MULTISPECIES: YdcH family protein [Luteibacter]
MASRSIHLVDARIVPAWLPSRPVRAADRSHREEIDMFENQQRDDVEKFIHADAEIRRLYFRHKELDSKLEDAGRGCLALGDEALTQMKREKLQAKEQLQRMWETWQKSRH